MILYSTNYNDIYLKSLNPRQGKEEVQQVYEHRQTKSLIQDHYLSAMVYLPHPTDKLFSISQMRPDVAHQTMLQEQRERDVG